MRGKNNDIIHWMCAIVSMFLLLTCATTVALWARSYVAGDEWLRMRKGTVLCIQSDRGRILAYGASDRPSSADPTYQPQYQSVPWSWQTQPWAPSCAHCEYADAGGAEIASARTMAASNATASATAGATFRS